MKKTFKLTATNKTDANHVDSIKHEVNKYISRERRKKLPDNVDFWDFNCSIGTDEKKTAPVHVSQVKTMISQLASEKNESFYLEILATPGYRSSDDKERKEKKEKKEKAPKKNLGTT
jgi:hypothetical protein